MHLMLSLNRQMCFTTSVLVSFSCCYYFIVIIFFNYRLFLQLFVFSVIVIVIIVILNTLVPSSQAILSVSANKISTM